MERTEAAALKNSLRKEMALKSSITPQVFLEDIWVVNNSQNGVPCDDFFVDDLFDFTNDEGFLEQQVQQLEHEVQEQEEASSHKKQKLSPRQVHDQGQHFLDDIINFSDQELAVPADDVANLEWLSHFIEDSFSEHSAAAAYPARKLTEKPNLTEPEKPVPATCNNKIPVPGKARSKRTRTGGRVWSLDGSPPVTESSSSSMSSSSSSLSGSGSGSSSAPWVLCSNSVLNSGSIFEVNGTEPASVEKKKHKKRPVATESTGENVNQPTRRCSHCGVTKTPQWRAGPMGAKTLCNACGVRFKSGRLLPEYRPACSPTFSTELHSNHHRKVIEMRRKKEGLNQVETCLVSNFG